MPLQEQEAKAEYQRIGNSLDRLERFESHAKALGLAWLAPAPGERVVELGVGTGRTTLPLLEAVGPEGRVWGVDLAPHMLERTRERAAAAGVGDRLTLVEASASATGLADGCADALYTSYVLDLFPEEQIDAAIREARRLVRPGARAVFVGMTPGRGVLARSLMMLWGLAHALNPRRVGG